MISGQMSLEIPFLKGMVNVQWTWIQLDLRYNGEQANPWDVSLSKLLQEMVL